MSKANILTMIGIILDLVLWKFKYIGALAFAIILVLLILCNYLSSKSETK